MKVSNNKIISIHYTVTDDNEVVVDSNMEFEPLTYLHGAGNILPALEQQLEGAVETEVRNIMLMPCQAYGNYDSGLVVIIDKNIFWNSTEGLEPGMRINTSDGNEVEIIKVLSNKLVVNHNHPLAGKRLHFIVRVERIRTATGKELLSGRPMSADEWCGPDCSCYF